MCEDWKFISFYDQLIAIKTISSTCWPLNCCTMYVVSECTSCTLWAKCTTCSKQDRFFPLRTIGASVENAPSVCVIFVGRYHRLGRPSCAVFFIAARHFCHPSSTCTQWPNTMHAFLLLKCHCFCPMSKRPNEWKALFIWRRNGSTVCAGHIYFFPPITRMPNETHTHTYKHTDNRPLLIYGTHKLIHPETHTKGKTKRSLKYERLQVKFRRGQKLRMLFDVETTIKTTIFTCVVLAGLS